MHFHTGIWIEDPKLPVAPSLPPTLLLSRESPFGSLTTGGFKPLNVRCRGRVAGGVLSRQLRVVDAGGLYQGRGQMRRTVHVPGGVFYSEWREVTRYRDYTRGRQVFWQGADGNSTRSC